MAQTVVGIFDDADAAQRAVSRLTAYGFSQEEIDISGQRDIHSGERSSNDVDHSDDGFGERVSRFFKNLFDDEGDAERHSALARSGTVVSVYATSRDEAERAADILDEHGAVNVDERATMDYEPGSTADLDGRPQREDSSRSIPVIEEDLQVGKREVDIGGMRVRSRIIERPVEESLRLRSERVSVDRTPANRPATESDLDTFREGEIELRESAEEPVISKNARVVEEVNVRKDVEEHEETVRDTVRKSDVDVERMDKGGLKGSPGTNRKG